MRVRISHVGHELQALRERIEARGARLDEKVRDMRKAGFRYVDGQRQWHASWAEGWNGGVLTDEMKRVGIRKIGRTLYYHPSWTRTNKEEWASVRDAEEL